MKSIIDHRGVIVALLLMAIGVFPFQAVGKEIRLYIQGVDGKERTNVLAYLSIARLVDPPPSKIQARLNDLMPLLGQIYSEVTGQLEKAGSSVVHKSGYVGTQPLQISEQRLRWLFNNGKNEIREALKPYGYYQPKIESSLKRHGKRWVARYNIDQGPVIRIITANVKLLGDGAHDKAFLDMVKDFPMSKGSKLREDEYEDFKNKLELLATERGYFNARFRAHEIAVNLKSENAAITLVYDTGTRYKFGNLAFSGGDLSERFLKRFVNIKPGTPYDSNALMSLQSDLIGTDYFTQVEMDTPFRQAKDYEIPMTVALTMRKQKRLTFGLGYGTDTGVRGKVGLEYRWINRWGHRLQTDLVGSAIKYGGSASYFIPGKNPAKDFYKFNTVLLRENSDAQDSINWTVGAGWTQKFKRWEMTLGLNYTFESFKVDKTKNARLLIPSLELIRKKVDDPLNIHHGSRFSLNLQGSFNDGVVSKINFIQALMDAKYVRSVWNKKGRFIAHSKIGITGTPHFSKLPTTLRFYAGGDNSVRGYEYQSITPEDVDGNKTGGRYLMIGSLEYEQRFLKYFGVAAFVDAGDAFTRFSNCTKKKKVPLTSIPDPGPGPEEKIVSSKNECPKLFVGAGLGIRWYLPFGPVRMDFAHGFTDPPGSAFKFHFTVGPEI